MPGGGSPPSAAIDDRSAKIASYFIGHRHELIHRHTESIDLSVDQTARWRLKIDFELPTARRAQRGRHDGEAMFLFPLLFLRKAEGRTGFEAHDERGAGIPLPNRSTSDRVSALAAARAASRLLDEARSKGDSSIPRLPAESLEYVFLCIARWRAYDASVILNHLLKKLDPQIVEVWDEAGLTEDLEMMVDHSLVWVPLRGLPGERRSIDVGHDVELRRRPLLRWHFGELRPPRFPRLRWRRARQRKDRRQVLDTGGARYGRTAWRISFSVLGERLAQPLAWMPIEFDFPTIYTRRCSSYHFEMNCPRGLSPRGVKVGLDREDDPKEVTGRTTIGTRAAHVYLPGGRWIGDATFRATVGIGNGVLPVFWVPLGVITTAMLWALVAFNPNWLIAGDTKNHNEIAAAVLLIVPALLGALAVGATDDDPVSSLMGGVRLLLLVTGLCCVAATAVLIKVDPFSSRPQATWAVCAAIATAATIPMATSWLLGQGFVWRGLKVLNSVWRQYAALLVQVVLGLVVLYLLSVTGDRTALRAALASCLLLLTVTLILLASNRLAVQLETSRRFVSVGAILVAAVYLALGCVELQSAFAPHAHWHVDAETVGRFTIVIASISGLLLWLITQIFGPREEELSIAPQVGRALIAGERIRELRRLRELDSDEDESRFFGFPLRARDAFRRAG